MCYENAASTVGIGVLLQKHCHEVERLRATHATNTGQKPMHALRGAQGNDFTGKAESMKMGMNL